MPEFFAGLDLGQANDYSALAIAEVVAVGTGEEEPIPGSHVVDPDGRSRPATREKTERRYDLRHLQRFPLHTDYPAIVDAVAALLGREPLGGADVTLALDFTGVGRPIFDLFAKARLRGTLVPVTIHGGDAASRDGRGWRVPKRELISATQVLLQTGRLRIAGAGRGRHAGPGAGRLPRQDQRLGARQLRRARGAARRSGPRGGPGGLDVRARPAAPLGRGLGAPSPNGRPPG